MHENRETSGVPRSSGDRGRCEKVQSRTSDMHALDGSDRAVLPMNQPNKEGQPSAEVGEGRAQTEENIVPPNMRPTQSGNRMSQGLNGVRQVAREREQERFPMTRDRVVPIMRASVSWYTLGTMTPSAVRLSEIAPRVSRCAPAASRLN